MRKNYARHILTGLLILATVNLMVNTAVNWHSHKLNTGQIVSHAHPYNNTNHESKGFPSHRHTQKDFLFYEVIFNLLFLSLFLILIFTIILGKNKHSFKLKFSGRIFLFYPITNGYRGTPSLI